MPQLDYTLIFNQIFWLFLMFVLLYIVICYYFLPALFKIFKTRNKILKKTISEAKIINKTLKSQALFYKKNIKNCSKISTFVQSVSSFFKKYETGKSKNQLLPSSIVHFVSAKILFTHICKSLK